MYIHKKGYGVISTVFVIAAIIVALVFIFVPKLLWLQLLICLVPLAIFIWSITFFRVPTARITTIEKDAIVSAADGEVVVIEEVEEKEYFHDKRIQISIFMSAYNVHVNWFPINGIVSYYKYHPGKKLFAINPKSSELNERNTLVVKDEHGREVLFRQIAGVMARRIICHVDKGAVKTSPCCSTMLSEYMPDNCKPPKLPVMPSYTTLAKIAAPSAFGCTASSSIYGYG